jgi:NitT/TauT family transport system substrate-binding protein
VANPWPGYSFVFLAEEKGFFDDEHLSVRLLELGSLADARRVFEQGHADAIFCTLVEVMLMNEPRGEDFVRAFSVTDYSNGGDMLLARQEVRNLHQLKGRRIGLEPGSLDALCVHLALSSANLSLDDVVIVPLAQAEMQAALEEGAVDAVQVYPPAADSLLSIEGVHKLWDSSQVPGVVVDVLAANEAVLQDRQDDLHAFLRAYSRAQTYFREHPEEALDTLARRCRLSKSAMRRSFAGMKVLWMEEDQTGLFADGSMLAATETTADGLIAVGMLKKRPAVPPIDGRLHAASP